MGYQTSGSAMAESSDPKCRTTDLQSQFGRHLAIGSVTFVCGSAPCFVLRLLHRRDFVVCSHLKSAEWRRAVRSWRLQDAIIYAVGGSLTIFFFGFDMVFVANVTLEDGFAWSISCGTSLAEMLFGMPALMTVFTLLLAVPSRLLRWIQHETMILCLLDVKGDVVTARRSQYHRPPKSRWNSKARRKKPSCLQQLQHEETVEAEETFEPDDFCNDVITEAPSNMCFSWTCQSMGCHREATQLA